MSNTTVNYDGILFDLDGTILDTALDLASATNHVLSKFNIPPISDKKAKMYASDGMQALIKSGINPDKWDSFDFKSMKCDFIKYYHDHIADRTCYFDGMKNVISTLQELNVPIAIVTNKPDNLTHKVLQKFEELKKIQVVIGPNLLTVSKPDPLPLLYACKELNVNPNKCIYVGDHFRDIEAGHNANMKTILAVWGYIHPKDNIDSFNADYIAHTPKDILKIISL
ncbi:MAG: HAD family hydrolase [Succinivibrionaceae bacterium]